MALACLEKVPLKEGLNLQESSPPPTLEDDMHESIVFIRILRLITPVRFNSAIAKGAIPHNKIPWIAKGKPMPSASAALRNLRQPARLTRYEDRYTLANVWHWKLPAEDQLWHAKSTAPTQTSQWWPHAHQEQGADAEHSAEQFLHATTLGMRALRRMPEETWDF